MSKNNFESPSKNVLKESFKLGNKLRKVNNILWLWQFCMKQMLYKYFNTAFSVQSNQRYKESYSKPIDFKKSLF